MLRTISQCVAIFFALCAGSCTKNEQAQQITLHVSETHRKLFPDLKPKVLSAADAGGILANMAEKGDRFCRDTAAQKPQDHYKTALLGCRNWYAMSDLGPDADFMKINIDSNLRNRHAFDCYAVGFLQPYIMAANLNCVRLNIVDIDFRIIKAHLDFLNRAKARPGANIRELIGGIKLSFPAGIPDKSSSAETNLSLADLCGKNSETKCMHYLVNFLTKFAKIKEINLILSPLHEFMFLPDKLRLESVFYTSNAFDPHFTSERQFEQFRLGFGKNSEDVDRFIIYHQAEEKQFAVYKINKALQISTVCADRFQNVIAGRYSENRCRYFPGKTTAYETYFDKKSLNHQAKNPCSEKD